MIPMNKKCVRIDVTSEQFSRLRQEVFCNLGLSGEDRRRAVKKALLLPADGSRVDLYCEGKFVGAV